MSDVLPPYATRAGDGGVWCKRCPTWSEDVDTIGEHFLAEHLAAVLASAELAQQTQQALAASQQDLTTTRGAVVDLLGILDTFQVASGADRNASLQTGIDAVRQTRTELEQLRTAQLGVLAELRQLAAANRRDACTLRSPDAWGPNRAAEAYEKAAALVEHINNPNREEPTT